jgi:hypothetical protein
MYLSFTNSIDKPKVRIPSLEQEKPHINFSTPETQIGISIQKDKKKEFSGSSSSYRISKRSIWVIDIYFPFSICGPKVDSPTRKQDESKIDLPI